MKVIGWLLEFDVLATSEVISEWYRFVTVHTHSDLTVLPDSESDEAVVPMG